MKLTHIELSIQRFYFPIDLDFGVLGYKNFLPGFPLFCRKKFKEGALT